MATVTIAQTCQRPFAENKAWSDDRKELAFEVLGDLPARHFLDLADATFEQDTQRATDAVIRVNGGTIGLRLRRSRYSFRDFTIRSMCRGHTTEWDKLHDQETRPRLYFYGWMDAAGGFADWVVVDMDTFVDGGFIDHWDDEISNGDGTGFKAYRIGASTPWVIAASRPEWVGR